jgi:tetratricopeptide (TPR) repeat protein
VNAGLTSRPREDHTSGPPGATSLGLCPAFGLLLAFLVLIALLPDEALLRTKAVWGRGILECAAAAALVAQACAGRLHLPWPTVLFAAALLPLLGLTHVALSEDLLSRSLAHDELIRLALLPVALWTAGTCLAVPGRRRLLVGLLSALILLVAGYALVQNLSYELGLPFTRMERPPSTFGNPVFLAAFLVLCTPIAISEALFGQGWRRWLAAAAAGLAMPALLATQSRWAWLGFGVSLAVGTLLLAPTSRARHRLLAGLVLAGVIVAAANLDVLERPQRHALIWKDSWVMVTDAPWGVGPGQYPLAFLPYASAALLEAYPRSSYIVNDAHSEPLQILAELGWPGALAALAFVFAVVRAGRRTLARHPHGHPGRPLLAAALAAPFGAAVQSCGSPDLRFLVSAMVLGTLLGLAASFDDARSLAIPGGRPVRWALALVGVGLMALSVRATVERQGVATLLRPGGAQETAKRSHPQALQQLRDAAAERRDDAEAQYALGVALAADQRYDEAAEVFRRTALLAPGNRAVIRSLGISEGLAGQFQGAFIHLRTTLASRPDDHDVRYLLAFVAWRRGDIDTAVHELERLLADVPGHRQGRLLLERLRE